MALGNRHRRPWRVALIAVALVGVAGLGGCAVLGIENPLEDGEEWREVGEIERLQPSMFETGQGPYTDEILNDRVNEHRHESGLETVQLDVIARSSAGHDRDLEAGEVSRGDNLYCASGGIHVRTVLEYDSRYKSDVGAQINADESTVASDVIDEVMSNPEQRSALMNDRVTRHGVHVSVHDQGRVTVTQIFCVLRF